MGLSIEECGGSAATTVLYLDDGVFSGSQIGRDLSGWIQSDCPLRARVEIACMALHRSGEWKAIRPDGYVALAKEEVGKEVELRWWPNIKAENRLTYIDISDVLSPRALHDDLSVRTYSSTLAPPPRLRTGENLGRLGLFSSHAGRELLEQEFLKAGAQIRERAPNLNIHQRPLGNTTFGGLGFGSMVVTHRNGPNDAPLALWAGNPWHPLFPRRTN